MEELRLEYVCTQAEQNEAQELVFANQVARGSTWLGKLLMVFILMVCLAGAYFQALALSPKHPGYAGLGFFGLFCIVTVVRKRMRSAATTTTIVTVTTGELKLTSHSSQLCIPWNAFDRIWESETLFVLRHRSQFVVYVFPKRVYPDVAACDWFRAISNKNISALDMSAKLPSEFQNVARLSQSEKGITIQFTIGYRDYLDRSLASWFTRGIMCFFAILLLGTFIYVSLEPSPGAVHTTTEVWCFFCIPFLVVLECVIFLVVATHTWLSHRSVLTTQTITITDKGYMDESSHGNVAISWDQPTSFKETRWSFILWQPGTQVWTMLPKRFFPTDEEISCCRQILNDHAKQSTWFF